MGLPSPVKGEIELGIRESARRRRRGMRVTRWLIVVGISGCVCGAIREAAGQVAPAAATYVGVERTIESIRQAWSRPGARPEPNADGWSSLFDTLIAQLRGYSRAEDDVA